MRGIRQEYKGARGATLALDGFNIDVLPGQAVAILGPSGCGKSTSLLIAAGLMQASEGSALVDGVPVLKPRLSTALILQDFGLMPWKTVEQNAGLGLQVRRMPAAQRKQRVAQALAKVGLSDFAKAYPAELSGGMRQRLAMARALTCDLDLLLMDEPLSALDALLREDMQNMLKATWREQRYAQVLVTHSIEEAVFLGQRVFVMSGRPGHVLYTLENPEMEDEHWRDNPLFFERCRVLRDVLRGGAVHVGEGDQVVATEAGSGVAPAASGAGFAAEADMPEVGAGACAAAAGGAAGACSQITSAQGGCHA